MNKITGLSVSIALLAVGAVFAEITVKSDINSGTSWGKTKMFKEMPKEITVSQFNTTFMTTRVAGATAGSNANLNKVGLAMRAELDLTPEVAQAISDSGYAYFKAQLDAKGYQVKVHDLEALKNSKTFAKYSKKNDDAVVKPGGVVPFKDANRVDERLAAHATGVNGANLGKDPGPGYVGYTNLAIEMGGKDGKMTASVVTIIDFTESKTASSEAFDVAKASVSFSPSLQLIDVPAFGGQTAFNFHSERAVGGKVWGGQQFVNTDAAWLKDQVKENEGLVKYTIDPEAFKKDALELLKAYLDKIVAQIDAAKEAGK